MGKLEIDIQFWPWNAAPELLAYARKALKGYPYNCIWMCDEFQYEDPFTTMAAMAMNLDTSVGTMVTFPWRNPLDLAQRFAAIAKFTQPGRRVFAGLGAGGAVQVQVTKEKRPPLAIIRESVELIRNLLRGQTVELSRFPKLSARFLYNPNNTTKLYFPPPEPVPVYLAAAGPRMYEVAGRYADGVIFAQLAARTCPLGAKAGMLKQAAEAVDAARDGPDMDRPFKKLYASHISVSRDADRAQQWAKRNTSYALSTAYYLYPEVLEILGLDTEEIHYICQAYLQGLGVDEAARRVSDSTLRNATMVFAGTPDDCIGPYLELKAQLEALGFDTLVIGVPLGPNVRESLDLLSREVLPALVD